MSHRGLNLRHALLLLAVVLAPASAAAQASAVSPAASASYQQGVGAVRQQDWDLALQQFLTAQAADPYSPPILFNLGLVSEKIPGHQLRAIAWFQAYLLAAPTAADAGAVRGEVGRLEAAYEDGHRTILNQLDSFVPQAKTTIAQMSPTLGADWAKTATANFPYAAMNVASAHYLMADEPGALRVLRTADIDIFPGGHLVLPPPSGLLYGTRHLVTGMFSNHLHADEVLATAAPHYFTSDELAQVDYLVEFGELDRAKLFLERGDINGNLWLLGEERLLCAAHDRTDRTLFNQVSKHLETMLLVARAQHNTKTPFENQAIANLSDGLGIPDLVRLYLELGEVDRAKALADWKLDNSAVWAVADSLIDDFQKGRLSAAGVCPAELSVLIADDPPTWGSGDSDDPPAPLWWSTGRLAFLTGVGRNGVTYAFFFGPAMTEQHLDETEDLAAIQKVGAEIAASPQLTVIELEFLSEFEFEILNTYRMVRGQGP